MSLADAAEFADHHSVVVGARRRLGHPPAAVYALLSDLKRHWPLLGADLVNAGIVDDSGDAAAELLLRGPFPGIERRIVTHVTYDVPDTAFGGEAVAGATRAAIDWRLTPSGRTATDVAFEVGIDPGGIRDRILVIAARPWLDRRCGQVLERLERELGTAGRA